MGRSHAATTSVHSSLESWTPLPLSASMTQGQGLATVDGTSHRLPDDGSARPVDGRAGVHGAGDSDAVPEYGDPDLQSRQKHDRRCVKQRCGCKYPLQDSHTHGGTTVYICRGHARPWDGVALPVTVGSSCCDGG